MPKACVSLEFICFFIGARREKDKRKRGVGLTRPGETQAANVKQVPKSLPAISRKARFVVAGFPFFSVASDALEPFFFPERAHARSPREVGEKTRAVFLCTGGRVEAAFQLKAAEFPCGKSPAPVPQLRSTVAVGPFCFPGHSRSTAAPPPPRERTRTTKAPGSTGSPLPSHSSFLSPFWISEVLPPPHFTTSAGGFCSSMAAVTSPETSPQPRVYFQTPAGTTEEPETPVRKQGRVTVKYDRKELRKRLNLEEWIIDQLTDLYDCEVKTL